MIGPTTLMAIAVGGALGAVARHFVGAAALQLVGPGFPYGTLAVNIVGSFAMGVFVEATALAWQMPPQVRALIAVGFLGAFTTFSTYALDFATLWESRARMIALIYAVGSAVASILALFVGLAAVRMIVTSNS